MMISNFEILFLPAYPLGERKRVEPLMSGSTLSLSVNRVFKTILHIELEQSLKRRLQINDKHISLYIFVFTLLKI